MVLVQFIGRTNDNTKEKERRGETEVKRRKDECSLLFCTVILCYKMNLMYLRPQVWHGMSDCITCMLAAELSH